MSGTISGGLKAVETNKKRYGKDFYKKIGAIGGTKSRGGYFAVPDIGTDGLTNAQRAGSKGGKASRKNKSESK